MRTIARSAALLNRRDISQPIKLIPAYFNNKINSGNEDRSISVMVSASAVKEEGSESLAITRMFNNCIFNFDLSSKSLKNQQEMYESSDDDDVFEDKLISNTLKDTVSLFLKYEEVYHPSADFVQSMNEEIDEDEKVRACHRDEAVFNIRFLNNGFFHLSQRVFSAAVNMIDRFLIRIKVKPKYMMCVAVACFAIAGDIFETEENQPNLEYLVEISKCGGTVGDLTRMMDIVRSKLGSGLHGVTALDFMTAFLEQEGARLSERLVAQLDMTLCSVEVYNYRPSCLALALLTTREDLLPREKSRQLAGLCEISATTVSECVDFLRKGQESFYGRCLPSSRESLVWPLSKRTLASLSSSSPPPLATINENMDNVAVDNN